MTYVYVLQSGSGLVKVGCANNPEKRLGQLKTGCPYRLDLVYKQPFIVIPVRTAEAAVHEVLAAHRVHGEWFKVKAGQAIRAIKKVARTLGEPKPVQERRQDMTAPNIFITPNQSRAARAMLGVSYEEVRQKAGLGINTLQRFEKGHTNLNMSTVGKLVSAYAELGIEFPDLDTVRLVRREQAAA